MLKSDEVTTRTVTTTNCLTGKEYTVPTKKIYSKLPHITADNHFSGENVMEYIGKKGFGITTTCRRDRYPPGLKDFVHHEKVASTDKRTRVARFEQPIFAMRKVAASGEDKAYTRTLVSFQSTGATNFTGVNNLMSLRRYVQPKFRGNKNNKLAWATEQNEGRETYLNHYHGVDSMDHMIKNTGNRYTTWKFWHAPYQHALSMAIVASYDMYRECCSGELDENWKVKKPMTYAEFLLKLSEQLLTYDPANLRYPGDEKLRASTIVPKKRRRNSKDMTASDESFPDTGVTTTNLRIAREKHRFCYSIGEIEDHFKHMVNVSNAKICDACGLKTYWECKLCQAPLCVFTNRTWTGASCVFLYHKEEFFGLARSDYVEVLKKGWTDGRVRTKQEIQRELEAWRPANGEAVQRNARFISRLRDEESRSCNT